MDENNQEEGTRIPSMITTFRGHTFVSNLDKLLDSQQALKNLEILSRRNCGSKIDSLSYRTLHHWDSIGLIECERESNSGWRRFNLIEALWVYVIIKFRAMGVSLDSIVKAKPIFFEKIPGTDLKFFDYYLVAALYFKTPVFFVNPPEEPSEFLSYEEMISAMEVGLLQDCILIHLNPLMNKIFKKIKVESKVPFKRTVTPEQNKVCELLEQEDFDSIKLTKIDGKISNIEIEKGFSRDVQYEEIRKDQIDAVISTRIQNGLHVSTKLVKRVKLK